MQRQSLGSIASVMFPGLRMEHAVLGVRPAADSCRYAVDRRSLFWVAREASWPDSQLDRTPGNQRHSSKHVRRRTLNPDTPN